MLRSRSSHWQVHRDLSVGHAFLAPGRIFKCVVTLSGGPTCFLLPVVLREVIPFNHKVLNALLKILSQNDFTWCTEPTNLEAFETAGSSLNNNLWNSGNKIWEVRRSIIYGCVKEHL